MSGDYLEDYEYLLQRLYSKVPVKSSKHERFEVPKANVIHVGSQTVIRNFREIADVLRREPRLLMRYLLKELATSGSLDEDSGILVVNLKVSSAAINKLIEIFTKNYVICPTCGRPDTRLEKRGRVWVLVCEACGAETSVKPF